MSRRGPITKKWYTFSATPSGRRFACAKADAQYLMRMGDLAVVQQHQPPPPPQPAPQAVRAVPMPVPIPQVKSVEQPMMKAPVSLDEEAPADDLSEIKGVTKNTAGILALVGIRTFENLATLTAQGVERAAQLSGKSESQVAKWIEQAKANLGGVGKKDDKEEERDDRDGIAVGDLGDVGLDLPGDAQLAN